MKLCIISYLDAVQNTLQTIFLKDINKELWRLYKSSWKMFWQFLGWPKSKPAVKRFWTTWPKGNGTHFMINGAQRVKRSFGDLISRCDWLISECVSKFLSGWPRFVWSHWIYTITQLIKPSSIELNCGGQGGTGKCIHGYASDPLW